MPRPTVDACARILISFSLLLLLGASLCSAQNTAIESFNQAKKHMAKVFAGHETTFYCGCAYTDKTIDHASCGYAPKKKGKRAKRLEWEHVVPAHAFGQSFKAWREGHPNCVDSSQRPFKGRNCARKTEKLFRFMEADLYNLQPAIGEVNGLRSNFSMEMIPGEKREFGACDVEIENNKVEPRPEIRGDIARTYRYMNHAYPGRGIISRSNEKLFAAWDKMDPIDDWERERARRIERIQGNRNSFVFPDGEAAAAASTPATTIIGNRKSKVYHRPDCPSYDQVSSHNRVSFASETAARTAGYRLAGNCP
jgi:deoxyribonuclease-1